MRHIISIAAGALALSFIGCACHDRKGNDNTVQATEVRVEGEKRCGAYVLIPAVYETECQEVEVSSARVDKERVDAVYQNVTVQELVTPGRWTQEIIPAAYRTESERVMVSPARSEWQKVPCASVNVQNGEKLGDAYCLVELPAVYSTQTKQCVATAAITKRNYVPAVYKDVQSRVLIHEAFEREVPIAAKTESRSSQRLVTPARWEWRWGDECPGGEGEMVPKATEPSPAPPFPLNGVQPDLTVTPQS